MRITGITGAIAALVLYGIGATAHADTRNFTLANFETVKVEGDMNVEIVTADTTAVRAEGDRRLLDRLDLRVDNRVLSVRMGRINAPRERRDGTDATTPPVTIYVSARDIGTVSLIGGGSVSVERLTGRSVRASLYGPGTMRVYDMDAEEAYLNFNTIGGKFGAAGKTDALQVSARGKGILDATYLLSETLNIIGDGPVESAFTISGTARIIARDKARIVVAGEAECTVTTNRDSEIICGEKPVE